MRATVVLVQARWARRAGMRVAVAYRSNHDNYLDRRETARDGWTQYFEPLAPAVPDRANSTATTATNAAINPTAAVAAAGPLSAAATAAAVPLPPQPPALLVSLDCGAAAALWGRDGVYRWSHRHLARQREWRASLVAELPVRPRARFYAAAAAVFAGNNSLGRPLQGPVLGVHMRGTDRAPCESHPAELVPLVRAYLRKWPAADAFIATDDSALLAQLRARLGGEAAGRVAWLDTLRGASTLNPGVRATRLPGWDGGHERAARLGHEILVDTLVLSRCAFLIASLSAVPEYAVALSPHARLQRDSFLVDVADYPAPEWGRAEAVAIRAARMRLGNNVPNMASFEA